MQSKWIDIAIVSTVVATIATVVVTTTIVVAAVGVLDRQPTKGSTRSR
jgi:ABC-type spermidine/putrescine transport system permease subunit II